MVGLVVYGKVFSAIASVCYDGLRRSTVLFAASWMSVLSFRGLGPSSFVMRCMTAASELLSLGGGVQVPFSL